jgi:uncharacterized protein YcgI (DUF1989 family)
MTGTTRFFEKLIPPRQGAALTVEKGRYLKVIDVEGGQIVDFVVINANNYSDRFSQARTKANQGKIFISTGDKLYSRFNTVMMTIVEDTYGIHDLQYGMCSRWVYESMEYKGFADNLSVGGGLGKPNYGCFEILSQALAPYGIKPEDIPEPFNIFQTVEYDWKTGAIKIIPGKSKPGDYIILKANIDCLVGVSACPSAGKPVKIEVYE